MNNKQKILETAIRLFVEQGFENTPTAQITRESGVASGTLFYHYKTKEALMNAAYMHIKNDMLEDMNSYYVEEDDFELKLKKFWIGYTKWSLKNMDYNLFFTLFLNSKYISKESQLASAAMLKKYRVAYEEEMKKGTLKEYSYEMFGNILFTLHQVFIMEFSKRKKINEKELEDSFDVLWDAVTK